MVMIESLACGTPVVATRRGSVPEVLEHGRTGIIVDHHRDLAAAVAEADRIDPLECRRAVEERFTPRSIGEAYLAAFRIAIASNADPPVASATRRVTTGLVLESERSTLFDRHPAVRQAHLPRTVVRADTG